MTISKLAACGGLTVMALAGCAAVESTTEVTPGLEAAFSLSPPEARVEKSKAEAFKDAMRYFASNNTIVTFADAASGAIYVESLGPAIESVADCGRRVASSPVDATSRVAVTVTPTGDRESLVSIATEFTQIRQFGVYPSFRVRCDSRGLIEQSIIAYIEGRDAPSLLNEPAHAETAAAQ